MVPSCLSVEKQPRKRYQNNFFFFNSKLNNALREMLSSDCTANKEVSEISIFVK